MQDERYFFFKDFMLLRLLQLSDNQREYKDGLPSYHVRLVMHCGQYCAKNHQEPLVVVVVIVVVLKRIRILYFEQFFINIGTLVSVNSVQTKFVFESGNES